MINGKVYRVICNETNETYYGSTVQSIKTRMYQHTRANVTRCKSIIDRGNYRYEVCEEVVCDDRTVLYDRERFWIQNNECINKQIPNRKYPEFYKDNRDKILQYKKEHYQKNRQRLLDYKKYRYNLKKNNQIYLTTENHPLQ